jgi:GntP family gluconate:H+ symporter
VPPTPGPIGVAFMFKIDLGQFMLLSVLLAIPIAGVALIFIRYYSKKFSNFSSTNFIEENIDEQKLPSIFNSFMPICLPILLIISNAIIPFLNINTQINQIMNFLGNPVIAIGIGLLWALATLCLDKNKDEVILLSDKSLSSAASIIFVTGAGGALGHVLSISEAGKTLATTLTQTSLPLIILPFLISAILKILQGSSTVAMLTSAAICSPILLDTNLNPILAAMSCTVGGMFASHFNDSYFWVLCKNLNINNSKHQLKYWTNLSILMSLSGLLILIIINMFV